MAMVKCDHCSEWYHADCIGKTESELKKMATFACQNCGNAFPVVAGVVDVAVVVVVVAVYVDDVSDIGVLGPSLPFLFSCWHHVWWFTSVGFTGERSHQRQCIIWDRREAGVPVVVWEEVAGWGEGGGGGLPLWCPGLRPGGSLIVLFSLASTGWK